VRRAASERRAARGLSHRRASRGPSQRRASREPSQRRASRGFTLLEVLVATAILGVAVVTLLGLHARNLGLASVARNLTIAGTLAGDVLAIARLDPAIEEGAIAGRFVATADEADGKSRIYGGPESAPFSWTREVLPTALPTLRQIRVSVSRDDEDRVLAELWAAMSLQPGIRTGTQR
jgi:prepilin-type N-terminal cleavage/methylation domain-containing protein